MKLITTIQKVSLTFDELMSCSSVPSNRCGYLNQRDALNNGFSSHDWDQFIKRASKLKKIIKGQGFSQASHFTLATDENGTIYLLDGQGRRKALQMLSEEVDISQNEFTADLYTQPLTIEEMSKLIKDMNTANTNWKTQDIRRSDAIASNDEEIKKAFEYVKSLTDEYGVNNYMANLLTYGECASHQRTNSSTLSTRDYAITKDIFTHAYLKVISSLSQSATPNGDNVDHPSSTKQKIRNSNFGISFVACLRKIVRYYDGDLMNALNDITYFVERIIEKGRGVNKQYVEDFVKCPTKDQSEVANKIRSNCRRPSVRKALYKTVN